MTSFTRTIALEQTGSVNGGVWTEVAVGTPIAQGVAVDALIGLIYNVQLTGGAPFSSDPLGRSLDAPLWASSGTITFTNITNTLGATLTAFFVPNPAPALWGASNLPTTTGAIQMATGSLGTTAVPGTNPITLSFSTAIDEQIRGYVTSRALWTGRIAVVVDWDLGLTQSLTASSWTNTTLAPFFGGLTGAVGGPRRRAVRDHRYAMPAMNSELVRDGDQPGLWVRPWDADPFDEPNTYRPRPGEGTVDDPIGDL